MSEVMIIMKQIKHIWCVSGTEGRWQKVNSDLTQDFK